MYNAYTLTMAEQRVLPDGRFLRRQPGARVRARAGGAGCARLASLLRDAGGAAIGGALADVHQGWLHIEVVWVEPGFRRRGHGLALLAALEQEAVARGCRLARIETTNLPAMQFYVKQGYRILHELHDVPPGQTCYWLQKPLPRVEARAEA